MDFANVLKYVGEFILLAIALNEFFYKVVCKKLLIKQFTMAKRSFCKVFQTTKNALKAVKRFLSKFWNGNRPR